MALKRRVEQLEESAPGPREPLVVTIRHLLVEPSPDGPRFTGEERVTRYVDGRPVEDEEVGVATGC